MLIALVYDIKIFLPLRLTLDADTVKEITVC